MFIKKWQWGLRLSVHKMLFRAAYSSGGSSALPHLLLFWRNRTGTEWPLNDDPFMHLGQQVVTDSVPRIPEEGQLR